MSATEAPERVTPRMLVKYREEVVPGLREQFGYKNPMQVPRLTKIVVNMGLGKAVENKARIEHAQREIASITGQKPTVRLSRVAIAGFKIREGYPVGCAVTLRGSRMWEFFDRFVSVAVPRIRDFRGFARKLDGRGNYSVGLSEQSIFPEISLDRIEFVQGMHVTFVTTARNDEEGFALLERLGFPFRK
ncbi:MAG: 50S ribosomal protein L5 [Planctomycetes bacterium]|nr:50S ribosomal protein L5 [Planctomycetota bacterium]